MDTPDRDYEPCPECGAPIDMTDPRQIARHRAPGHAAAAPPVPGLDRGGLIENNDHTEEVGYFETCRACCQTYDKRISAEVLHHEAPGHKPLLPA
jgi:hypothetical protein